MLKAPKFVDEFLLKYCGLSGAKACKCCRSRQERSNEYFLAKIGVNTDENEPLKVHLSFKLWDLIFTEPPRPLEGSERSDLMLNGFSLFFQFLFNPPPSGEQIVHPKSRLAIPSKQSAAKKERFLGHYIRCATWHSRANGNRSGRQMEVKSYPFSCRPERVIRFLHTLGLAEAHRPPAKQLLRYPYLVPVKISISTLNCVLTNIRFLQTNHHSAVQL